MQNDLISRSAAKDEILSWAVCINKPHLLSRDDTMYVLDTLPAVDAVEVVRCKDCKFYETGVEYYGGGTKDVCRLLKRQMLDDDFCSYGERRADE